MRRRFMILVFLALVAAGTVAAQHQEIVCVSTIYEPFIVQEGATLRGIDFDVVAEICRRLDIKVTFKLLPWTRLEQYMRQGDEQCVVAYFETPERLEFMDFMNVPIHITAYTVFVQAGFARTFYRIEDLEGMIIGVNRGFKTTPEFDAMVKSGRLRVEEVTEDAQSFQKLALGRIDGVLTNYHVGMYTIKKLGLEGVIKPLFPPLSSTSCYLTFSKKSGLAYLIPAFDAALFEIMIDGTYQRIFNRYVK